jgi:hypothetical protein
LEGDCRAFEAQRHDCTALGEAGRPAGASTPARAARFVYAYLDELDDWWESRRNHIVQNGAINDGSMESDSDVSQADSIAAPIRPRVARWAWLAPAVLCATTMALGVWLLSRGVAPAENTIERRVAVDPPTGMTFVDVEISPDGRHLAFTAVPSHDDRAARTLWVQRADSLEARPLPDTADASLPFWSPSSDALGFFAEAISGRSTSPAGARDIWRRPPRGGVGPGTMRGS